MEKASTFVRLAAYKETIDVTIAGLAVSDPRVSAGSTVVPAGTASGGPIRELGQKKRTTRKNGKGSPS